MVGLWAGSIQNTHPGLGAGMKKHSRFFDKRWERLFRSLRRVTEVVYNGSDMVRTPQAVGWCLGRSGTTIHAPAPEGGSAEGAAGLSGVRRGGPFGLFVAENVVVLADEDVVGPVDADVVDLVLAAAQLHHMVVHASGHDDLGRPSRRCPPCCRCRSSPRPRRSPGSGRLTCPVTGWPSGRGSPCGLGGRSSAVAAGLYETFVAVMVTLRPYPGRGLHVPFFTALAEMW